VNLNVEGMPVQSPAFVIIRDIGQQVRRLDGEDFEYFHENNRTEKMNIEV